MEFPEAVRLAVRERVLDFSGRSRRSEYWWFWVFYMLAWTALYFLMIFGVLAIGAGDGDPGVGATIFLLFMVVLNLLLLVPGISVTVRRLHDLDRRGWWMLILLIPIVGFFFGCVMLYWFTQVGTLGPNRFGLDPKGHEVF